MLNNTPLSRCPVCGRRHRPHRAAPANPAPLSLFDWANRHRAVAHTPAPAARILLLDTCRDAEGQPRPGLLIPGRRLPVVFPTIAAALAAKKLMEAA